MKRRGVLGMGIAALGAGAASGSLAAGAFLEMRVYKARPGKRAELDTLFRDGIVPMLLRHKVTVVDYGPSLHDPDSYCLLRAYASIAERERQLKGFYGSDEFAQKFAGPADALIESYNTAVIPWPKSVSGTN